VRRKGNYETVPLESLDVLLWADFSCNAETCAEAEQAARAVARLRPDQQKVLELGLLGGMSHSEIADRTRHAARYRQDSDASRPLSR